MTVPYFYDLVGYQSMRSFQRRSGHWRMGRITRMVRPYYYHDMNRPNHRLVLRSIQLVRQSPLGVGYIYDTKDGPNHQKYFYDPCPQEQQKRYETSGSSRRTTTHFPTIHSDNPFDILGIPSTSSYDIVKRRFVELAMQYHPDIVANQTPPTANNSSGSSSGIDSSSTATISHQDDDAHPNQDTTTTTTTTTTTITTKKTAHDAFITIRQAFEQIVRDLPRHDTNEEGRSWTEDEFQAWLTNEIALVHVSFDMDVRTAKEVIQVANEQAQGGLDRGGMWEMARSMAYHQELMSQQQQQQKRQIQKDNMSDQPIRIERGMSAMNTNTSNEETTDNHLRGPRRRRKRP